MIKTETTIGAILDALCDYFDDELERQQNVLVVCRAIGRAARAQDTEYLEAKTEALQLLLREAVAAEKVRLELVGDVVDWYQLPEDEQTLSGLITQVPMPWEQRMREFQVLMRATLESTRRLVRENNQVMKRSMSVLNRTLSAMALCQPESHGNYNEQGGDISRMKSTPTLIDQRG
ncbi:MAG: flagellar protein FlgN [Candidatus Hydrogenedentes bacterium]|nr:flagellar protein FlgN [Candidatus Hydrogenedentota bacterium]